MTVLAPTTLLTTDQRHAERLNAVASIYQGTDRILTGERLTFDVEDYPGAPAAWTDGNRIHINAAEVTAVDFDAIERLHGLNFHELAHVLYTPRRNTGLTSWVVDNYLTRSFNMLEDQRIETLLTTGYPSTVPWLTAAIARWVVGDPQAGLSGYLLVRGRRYLPGDLRGAFRASFIRPDLLPEVDRIVDAYRHLVFPNDYDAAKPLIEDFDKVIEAVNASLPQPPTGGQGGTQCPFGHGSRPTETLNTGRPKGPAEQRSTLDRADDGEPEQAPEPNEPGAEPQDSEEESEKNDGTPQPGNPGDGEPDQSGDESGGTPSERGSGNIPTGKASNSTQSDSDSDGECGQGAGGGAGKNLVDVATRILDNVRDDEGVRTEITSRLREVSGHTGSDTLPNAQWEAQTPDERYRAMYGVFRKALDRLRQQADPGWFTRQTSGKINVDRWTREGDLSSAFDAWDEGIHDATDLEVVILLDESGSMGNLIGNATNAMWVTKRALDYIDASTTVLTFDDSSRTLYHRKEKALPEAFRYSYRGGGTNPVMGLAQAARIFAKSKASAKVLIVFTDGDWGYGGDEHGVDSDQYIQKMNRSGVLTALGFMTDSRWDGDTREIKYNQHGTQVHANVTGDGLVPFIQAIVTGIVKTRVTRR